MKPILKTYLYILSRTLVMLFVATIILIVCLNISIPFVYIGIGTFIFTSIYIVIYSIINVQKKIDNFRWKLMTIFFMPTNYIFIIILLIITMIVFGDFKFDFGTHYG